MKLRLSCIYFPSPTLRPTYSDQSSGALIISPHVTWESRNNLHKADSYVFRCPLLLALNYPFPLTVTKQPFQPPTKGVLSQQTTQLASQNNRSCEFENVFKPLSGLIKHFIQVWELGNQMSCRDIISCLRTFQNRRYKIMRDSAVTTCQIRNQDSSGVLNSWITNPNQD